MVTGGTWRLGRCAALDGLRGVAIVLVVVSHSGPIGFYFGGGSAGVTLFFTLSGFLITTLMLDEHHLAGQVSLRAFYVRRARRLLPALFTFVGVCLGFGAITLHDALPTLLYVGNMPREIGMPDNWFLAHTWSLGVEEQFYLLWPLLLIASLRYLGRPRTLAATGALAIASVGERFLLWDGFRDTARVYQYLDTRADGLLVGCALALWLHGRSAGRARPLAAVVWMALIALLGLLGGALTWLLLPALVAVAAGAAILAVVRGPYTGWLTWRPLVFLGRRSYGLYLWHVPLVQVLRHANGWPWWSAFPLLGLSLVLALLSWRYVEQPFLLRGRRSGVIDAGEDLRAVGVA